jgi:hypothetical protein
MIRFLVTAALVGGMLQHVFGQDTRPRKAAPSQPRARKPARRASRRARPAASA